jgi:membrane dipeptidase
MASNKSERELYFDGHSDLPEKVMEERTLAGHTRLNAGEEGGQNTVRDEIVGEMEDGNIGYRVMAMSQRDELLPEMAIKRVLKMIAGMRREVDVLDDVTLATTAADVKKGRDGDGITMILGMEGGEPLNGDPELVDMYYELGVRLITFTHERRNLLGDGAPMGTYDEEKRGSVGGLSHFGYDVVQRVDELGMLPDLSHINEDGFWDAIDVTNGPVVASHSNCRALCDIRRNVSDEQIRAIADSGGIVGITAINKFNTEDANSGVEDMVDHVEHAVEASGIDHVGFGFDFHDYLAKYRPSIDENDFSPSGGGNMVEGIRDDSDIPNLGPALRDRGFTDEEVAKITSENWLRVFEEAME